MGRVMCPINSYASGFQGKFGTHEGVQLGLHGMLLRCTTPDYKNSQNVQDAQIGHTNFHAPKHGLFLSSFQIMYEPGNMLTGIRFFAEGMPIISNIQIQYNVSAGF